MSGSPLEVSDHIASLAMQVNKGMVRIFNGSRGAGAGSIIHPQGLIISNAHVIQKKEVSVAMGGGRVGPGRLVARDESLDLAAIVVEEDALPVIPMGNSSKMLPGELVFSLGFPWGVDGGLTYGVLIQIGPWPIENPRSRVELITASLHLRPGHSGGPMFNSRGEIIGLNTLMQGPDVGVAVPINQAKSFLSEAFEALG